MKRTPSSKLDARFAPLTPERWKDFESLFGARGACGGCWCMWWRLPHAQYQDRKGAHNRQAMQTLVRSGVIPGIIAYDGSTPAGWCAVAPREEYVRFATSRVLRPVDDEPVWSIVCFFIAKPFRGRGMAGGLIEAAVDFARSRGARIVEAYPIDAQGDRKADAFIYTGIASTFAEVGFVEVARRSETRPIMRIAV
jgi:GNAT superfamily N-acetyltransferase